LLARRNTARIRDCNGHVATHASLSGVCGASLPKRRRGPTHLDGVDALTLRLPRDRPLRVLPLRALATALLTGVSTDVVPVGGLGEAWRVKGLVVVEGQGPMLLQGVGDLLSLEPWPHEIRDVPFLVVIGEGLQREQIETLLHKCASEKQDQIPDAE